LANQTSSSDFDFKLLRDAFRDLDYKNTGTLHVDEFKRAFNNANMQECEI